MNPNIFREYDIRGIADVDLVDETAYAVGRAFASHLLREGRKTIIVGRDVRLSSDRIRNALVDGITAAGMNVIDVGVVPTPAQYFAIFHYNADGGIMVTGSHNPIEYNGFKMSKFEDGLAAVYGEEIQELKRIIENEAYESGSGTVEERDVLPDYIDMLRQKTHLKQPLKIVIDAGNGTGGLVAPKLFESLGCEVTCLYCEPDGRFPNHLPDPTVPKYIKDLQAKVLETGADVGLGFDGDSDRVGVIDNQGRAIYADKLLAIIARDLLQRHPGAPVVFDVKCSQALPEVIKEAGGKPVMWKTGHSLLKAKMKELKAPLAGEMSGHMFIADDFYGFDDAFFAAGRILQILSASDKNLAEIHDSVPAFESTPEIRIECTDETKFQIVEELVKEFKQQYEVIDVDGARVLFGDGWGLVRASNTQPVLVLRFEAKTQERLKEIVKIFKDVLRKYPTVKFTDEDFFGY
ncbi:MAG: phosphomannomutase/phosphoglucomutase [candidate division KSB1 bacterium]|nr:phosphomannomutase/phosphoglucomutase [candidate division KSB1 bacterium]